MLLKNSFLLSFFILAVVFLRACLLHKLPKRIFVVLWVAVLCRGLFPFSIPCRFSIYSIVIWRQHSGGTMLSGTLSAVTANIEEGISYITTAGSNVRATPLFFQQPLFILWVIGALLCIGYFLFTHLKFRSIYQCALPVKTAFLSSWLQIRSMKRPVVVKQSDRVATPFTYGVIRPVIILPKTIQMLSNHQLEIVLTHEWVHIQRFDVLLKWLLVLLVCIYWFHPLVWLMYYLVNQDIELSCDEKVVQLLGEEIKYDYAMTLVQLEETKSRCSAVCNHFSKNAIERRIVSVMKFKKLSIFSAVFALIIAIGTITIFATNEKTSKPSLEKQTQSSTETTAGPEEQQQLAVKQNGFIWPVPSCNNVTKLYGASFTGGQYICIGGPVKGEPIVAAAAGTVKDVGYDYEKGNYMVIDHQNGFQTFYYHCEELFVTTGQFVQQGEQVATVGVTGRVTGPCLSFGVLENGMAEDPMVFFQSNEIE